MTMPRIDYGKTAPGAIQAMLGLETYLKGSTIEPALPDRIVLVTSVEVLDPSEQTISMVAVDDSGRATGVIAPVRPTWTLIASTSSTGARGSYSPVTTSVGQAMPGSRSRRSMSRIAAAQPA